MVRAIFSATGYSEQPQIGTFHLANRRDLSVTELGPDAGARRYSQVRGRCPGGADVTVGMPEVVIATKLFAPSPRHQRVSR